MSALCPWFSGWVTGLTQPGVHHPLPCPQWAQRAQGGQFFQPRKKPILTRGRVHPKEGGGPTPSSQPQLASEFPLRLVLGSNTGC